MAKAPNIDMDSDEKVLWHDRKRILGMPISFTRYEVDNDRLTMRVGFFKTTTDELLLYRILDIKLTRTIWQKIFGVGTIALFSADQSDKQLLLKSIAHPEAVRKFISRIVERERRGKGVAGREIFGTASSSMGHGGCEGECHEEFNDIDGDGVPD